MARLLCTSCDMTAGEFQSEVVRLRAVHVAASQMLQSAQQRYAQDERVQLDLLADHLVAAFREAELPFNKLLAEQPLERVSSEAITSCSETLILS